jgi:hypothetical protein
MIVKDISKSIWSWKPKFKNEFATKKEADKAELDRIKSFEEQRKTLQNQLDIDKLTSQRKKMH